MLLLLAAARGWRGGWIVASLFDYVGITGGRSAVYFGMVSMVHSSCSVFTIRIFISCRIIRRNQYK